MEKCGKRREEHFHVEDSSCAQILSRSDENNECVDGDSLGCQPGGQSLQGLWDHIKYLRLHLERIGCQWAGQLNDKHAFLKIKYLNWQNKKLTKSMLLLHIFSSQQSAFQMSWTIFWYHRELSEAKTESSRMFLP